MKIIQALNILFLCATVVVLIALQIEPAGFFMAGLGIVGLFFCLREFRRNIALIYGAVIILGIAPIGTTTDPPNSLYMGLALFAVVFGPYFITKKIYKNNLVRFPFGLGREWKKKEIYYVFFTALVGYLILPVILKSSNSYFNWSIEPDPLNLITSYIGLNLVGIWDELFFVSTVLSILRRHLPFWAANMAQAVVFTSFLYTLGFQGWSPPVVYLFALSQGYIFKKTDSLLYVLTIHLTLDLVLHLTLVNLHHPQWLPVFVT